MITTVGAPLVFGMLVEMTVIARALGVRFPWFTPSLVAFGAATSTPGLKSHFRQDGGLQAGALAAEIAVHNDGANQFSAAFGAGVGKLIVAQQSDGDYSTFAGEAAPFVEATLGYRTCLSASASASRARCRCLIA